MIRKAAFALLCLLSMHIHSADNIASDNQPINSSEEIKYPHIEQLILASLDKDMSFDLAELDEEKIIQAIEQDLELYKKTHPEDPEGLGFFINLGEVELVEHINTTAIEKDHGQFPIEEELFNQNSFSELGFDADIEDLDTVLKNGNFEPQPPSKLICFLSKGYPLFACVMRFKNSFVTTCKTIKQQIAAQITMLARKISRS
ncbi:MAG TPA: hypothetical protein VGT41_01620 [Candidatus Babeliales bacterium]|nr:hypothetical protein [Candidatus Babeliales bacterium]